MVKLGFSQSRTLFDPPVNIWKAGMISSLLSVNYKLHNDIESSKTVIISHFQPSSSLRD